MINVEQKIISYLCDNMRVDEHIKFEDENKNKIQSIIKQYFSDELLDDETVKMIRYNCDFKRELLIFIQDKMQKIINDSSTLLFKELITVINLLSLGKNYKIFEQYNEFSSEGISELFREYESFLAELFENDDENFDLTFKYYLTLIEAYNELCIINSTDIKRKKTINSLIELVSESVNMLKFSVRLSEDKLLMLSEIQGKFLFYYAHILYITTEDKSLNDLLYEYKFILQKQVDGYFLSSHSKSKDEHYVTLLANSTNLLLLMLMKLKRYEDVPFEKLDEIIDIFRKECHIHLDVPIFSTSIEFKHFLLNNFIYIYDNKLDITYDSLLEHIINKNDFSSTSMQIIHNIVLFSDDIKEEDLHLILNRILQVEKFENDYHEYYKLKVIDIIINKFIQMGHLDSFKESIPSIIDYIQDKNTASHLMSLFSKIYLSISYYYSLLGPEYLEKSQKKYYIGEKICAYTLIKDEYDDIYKKILLNHANMYFQSLEVEHEFDTVILIKIGKEMMSHFFMNENIRIKQDLSIEISSLIGNVLEAKEYSKSDLEKEIAIMISKQIFFGLAQCYIYNDKYNFDKIDDIGYETDSLNLVNDYKMIFKYPYSYKNSFFAILNMNKDYIQSNINNLVLSYFVKTNKNSLFENYISTEEII